MENKRTFLIFGARGQLGREFAEVLSTAGHTVRAVGRETCDITVPDQIRSVFDAARPDVVINCAAYNLVDDAEDDRVRAFAVNRDAVRIMASLCAERHVFFVHFSTDYVFDGHKRKPYVETDIPNPLSVYAESKYGGETAVLRSACCHLLFRVSWVIGRGKQNFLYKVTQWAEGGRVLRISDDEISVPTFTIDIVSVTLRALEQGLTGLYHVTNSGQASRYELVKRFSALRGLKNHIEAVPMATFTQKAKRPGYSPMSNELISTALHYQIPSWDDRLQWFCSQPLI